MLNYELLSTKGIFILEPTAPLEVADFERLAKDIDPYIAKNGKLAGVMIYAKAFPGWVNIEAFFKHMRFIESHHQKIQRLAMVSDSLLLKEMPKLASNLLQAEVKHFPGSEYENALQWLGSNNQ